MPKKRKITRRRVERTLYLVLIVLLALYGLRDSGAAVSLLSLKLLNLVLIVTLPFLCLPVLPKFLVQRQITEYCFNLLSHLRY